MNPKELEVLLQSQIPLAKALAIKVLRVDANGAEVSAPLEPNRNHLGTAFGGSLNAVSVLSCYAWLFFALESRNLNSHVIVKKSEISYLRPVTGEFTAICQPPDQDKLKKFMDSLKGRSRMQLTLSAKIISQANTACEFKGIFVAQREG